MNSKYATQIGNNVVSAFAYFNTLLPAKLLLVYLPAQALFITALASNWLKKE
jgi:hypothetical protein